MSQTTDSIQCSECDAEMARLGQVGCTNMSCNPVAGQAGMCAVTFDPPPPDVMQSIAREAEARTRAAAAPAPAPVAQAARPASSPTSAASALLAPAPSFSEKLNASVIAAPAGLQGFDCDVNLDRQDAQLLFSQGFRFCVRYISRSGSEGDGDLTSAEADIILSAGLALMPAQHVGQNWVPSQQLGRQNGANAVVNARNVGFPAGVNVWLDLEGLSAGTAKGDVIDYCNAWFEEVAAAGFETGIYVGSGCILEAEDLYWRLKTTHYWKSGSKVPNIPNRGYQMTQKIIRGDKIGKVEIDRNVTQTDAFGGTVLWISR